MADLLCGKKVLGMCRARLSPYTGDCTYNPGDNAWVLNAFLELSYEVEREEASEILEKDLSNDFCSNFLQPGSDKYLNVTARFCGFLGDAFTDFTGWTKYVRGADSAGMGRPLSSTSASSFCAANGFKKWTLEVWSRIQDSSGFCSPSSGDGFIRLAFPMLLDIAVGGVEFANDATVSFSVTAKAYGNVGYGNGPFNDFDLDGGMAAGDGETWTVENSQFTLPAASCTPVPIPAQTPIESGSGA